MPNTIGRRVFLNQSGNLLALIGVALLGSSTARPQSTDRKTMKIESQAFQADGMIPTSYSCDGQDTSPPLSWDAPPEGAQSLALIVDDPDAPGRTFVHWVLYDIPPETQQLPEGVGSESTPGGGIQGKNDFGNIGYGGPCPPSGSHRYFFKLYALDRQLGLDTGATKAQLEAAMSGHILATAELIGRYSRS